MFSVDPDSTTSVSKAPLKWRARPFWPRVEVSTFALGASSSNLAMEPEWSISTWLEIM